MAFDLPVAHSLWTPPAIIRAAGDLGSLPGAGLNRRDRRAIEKEFGVKFPEPKKAMLPGMIPTIAGGAAPIAYVFHSPAVTTETNTTTYNFTVTSDGPITAVLVSGRSGSSRSLSSATLGGVASSALVSSTGGTASAVVIFNKAAAAETLSLTFSGAMEACAFTLLSLANVQSLTPVDTDNDFSSSASSLSLSAFSSPGAGGISLCVFSHHTAAGAISWANATEQSDVALDFMRHSGAVALGVPAGTISATSSGTSVAAIAGMALR